MSSAEGDGRILSQKIARDRFRVFQQEGKRPSQRQGGAPPKGSEDDLCERLVAAGKDGWDREYESVYALADAVCDRTIEEWLGGASKL